MLPPFHQKPGRWVKCGIGSTRPCVDCQLFSTYLCRSPLFTYLLAKVNDQKACRGSGQTYALLSEFPQAHFVRQVQTLLLTSTHMHLLRHSPAHAQVHVSVHKYKQVVHNTGAHSDTPGTQSGIGWTRWWHAYPGDLLLDRVKGSLYPHCPAAGLCSMAENHAQVVIRLRCSLKCL